MKNANILISVIIVLCIAAGVTAYGLANPEENVFMNLSGFTPEEDLTTDRDTQNTGGEGRGSGSSGTGSNRGGVSGISSSQANNIANDHIAEEGHYAGTPSTLDNGNWYVPVLDPNGNIVSGFEIDSTSGTVIGLI